jgi:hypothetical protein
VGVDQRRGAVDDGGERDRRRRRIVLGEPEHRQGVAHLCGVALRGGHLGEGLVDTLRFA